MKKLWNQNNEAKALIVSSILTILGFCGTAFLFWFRRYDIPLAVLTGGGIVVLAWLTLYLVKRTNKPHTKLEIAILFSRLILVTSLAILFAVLAYALKIVVVSPIYLIISYFVISLVAMIFYLKKGEENV